MNFSAPQTQTSGNAAYFLYQALQDATKQNPLTDALFGKNSLAQWAKDREQDIQDTNAIAAQDYLNKLDLDAITQAKNEGRDILSDYARGRWFFDKNNEKVRAANAARDAAESKHIRDKLKASAVARANQNQLKGNDAAYLLNELGVKNRTTDEMNDYRSDVQDAWLKRNSPEMYRHVAGLNTDDITGASARDYITKILADNEIDSSNASEFLDETKLSPYMQYEADRRIEDLLNKNPKIDNLEQIRKLKYDADRYGFRASSDKYNHLTNHINSNETAILDRTYGEIERELQARPDWEKITKNNTPDEIREKIILPLLQERTGYSSPELLRKLTSANQTRKAYDDSTNYTTDLDAQILQGETKYNTALEEANKNANFGSAIYGGKQLSVSTNTNADTSLSDKSTKATADALMKAPFGNSGLDETLKTLSTVSGLNQLSIKENLISVLADRHSQKKLQILQDLTNNPVLQNEALEILRSAVAPGLLKQTIDKAKNERESRRLKHARTSLGGGS